MKYSKIFIKHHTFNKRIHRLKELSRTYDMKPCKALKLILEKEMDLSSATMPDINPRQEIVEFCQE